MYPAKQKRRTCFQINFMAFNGSILIDHFKNPRNKGAVARPDVRREVHNRKCGDRLVFTARIRHGTLEDVQFEGEGCFFCLASASIACSTLSGQSVADALKRTEHIRKWIGGSKDVGGDAEEGGSKSDDSSKGESDNKGEGGGDKEAGGKGEGGGGDETGGKGEERIPAPDDEELASLGEIRAYPMRISCVDLAWEGMERILSRDS